MIEFIPSPIYDNWFKKYIPKKSLIICTPYIKQSAVNRLLEDIESNNSLSEVKIDVLMRGNSEEFTFERSSDINVLHKFYKMDTVTLKRISNLHMKAYLVDEKYLLITSGNLTHNGMFALSGKENFEGGISTDDQELIVNFLNYFKHIWEQGELLEDFYDEMVMQYNKYISEFTKKVHRKPKRSKYVFPETTIEMQTKYSLAELPSAKIDTLIKTLLVLQEYEKPLTRYKLGQELRKRYEDANDLDNATNNRKYGEEKGNLAVYLDLATQYKDKAEGEYVYELNDVGQQYLKSSSVDRLSYIIDQFLRKPVMCEIKELAETEGFDLKQYLYAHCSGEMSTLDRKVTPIRSFLKLFTPDGALIKL